MTKVGHVPKNYKILILFNTQRAHPTLFLMGLFNDDALPVDGTLYVIELLDNIEGLVEVARRKHTREGAAGVGIDAEVDIDAINIRQPLEQY